MKKTFYVVLSYIAVAGFLLYWMAIIIIAMPANSAKDILVYNAPRLKTMFGSSWKLFTPPYIFNFRLYFIVRDINKIERSDTLEVLEKISIRKQKRAPFNQKENIIDHLVNNNVAAIVRTVWRNNDLSQDGVPGNPDSAYISRAVAESENGNDYVIYLAFLNSYCKTVLKENKMDAGGKEVKIVIKEKMIRPFEEMTNKQYLQKEIIVFETSYKPIKQ